MATRLNSKEDVVALAQQLIAGMTKHVTGTTQVALLGGSFTSAEITSKLEQIVKLRADVSAAKATTKAKLAAEKADMPALRADERAPDARESRLRHPARRARGLRNTSEAARTAHARGEGRRGSEAQGHSRGAAYDGLAAAEGD